jgi:hypothetical protein
MAAAAAFLVLLDAAIISATPNLTKIAFAVVVSLVVGYVIFRIWRSNSKLEKSSAAAEKGPAEGGKAGGERIPGTRRNQR